MAQVKQSWCGFRQGTGTRNRIVESEVEGWRLRARQVVGVTQI